MLAQSHPPGRFTANQRTRLLDTEELDLADYLRDESEDVGAEALAHKQQGFAALLIGAVGVVYGDIGTSPIYAFREALHAAAPVGVVEANVLGLLSLLIWTLILVVTVKYVFVLLRADNRGEGGILAIYTLARLSIGHRSLPVLMLAICGAALFAGDAIITPAISVLSAVEGAGLVLPSLTDWVVPTTLAILMVLFAVQSRGTGPIAVAFGPIMCLWFLTLAGFGLWHLVANPAVLAAFNPLWGIRFLMNNAGLAFAVMGAVFLAVTGAEALYADLGHFGRRPIMMAWIVLVFPALLLNYLGQGAYVLSHPFAADDPFFHMVPPSMLPYMVLLTTAATVIASQAVISGAYSMARAAIQLGLIPRMRISHTSHDQSGQIYIAAVNWGLLIGVLWLVLSFRSSSALASAYGIAVTGTMIITTLLAATYAVNAGRVRPLVVIGIAVPLALIELAFLASNLVKMGDGGYVPVLVALGIILVMWAWWRGTQKLLAKAHRTQVGLPSFVASMEKSSVSIIPGTAFFLTPDPETVPSALLHNLKHYRGLHEQTVLLTVETLRTPHATEEERAAYERLSPRFGRLILRFGYMDTPNVARAMVAARRSGVKFDVMATTFFLGRKRPVVTSEAGLGRVLDRIYMILSRLAADPTEYYHLPRNRVVELGERVTL
ncbi:MAG TPA: potassium transporter Kup [Paracoccaceae bacterium]|nr:potassium transporter Kup [Paracoccaceae bacterium]